ncbi:hypothetical protein E0485_03530 [Paenibacillus albiflavus]|uniref:Flagellar hook-length control protein-like C-terminal domain-containing protein n=1 Tax=Paenibacillus albiflavus TaxID=2545760 RepID=A0A4R4EIH3_9BACL|nr:hypothetical protein [Paenibacillus albiflavus]TCZ79946.1 hypothetical protein E0485_03530 [Paenibacillus albiflavus]
MNISSLFRSMIGEPQASEVKVMELKPGQVVRGVVQQDLGNQEALITINGVQVRAKLEAPLQQGEATMLQVQNETASGQIVLKPVSLQGGGTTEAPFADLLKSFGLKDSSANRELILQMQSAGVPITKENVAKFAEMLAAKPANIDAKPWIQAMAVANARGLTLSTGTLQALTEVITQGNTLTNRLGALENEIRNVLMNPSSTMSEQTKAGLGKILQIMQQLSQLGPAQGNQGEAGTAGTQAGNNGQAAGNSPMQGAQANGTAAGQANAQVPASGVSSVTVPASTAGASGQASPSSEAQSGLTGSNANVNTQQSTSTSTLQGAPPLQGNAQSIGQTQANAQLAPQTQSNAQMQQQTSNPSVPVTGQSSAPTSAAPATTTPFLPTNSSETIPPAMQQVSNGANAAASSTTSESTIVQGQPQTVASQSSNTQGQASPSPVTSLANDESTGNWIGNALKLLGVDHEQMLAKGMVSQPSTQASIHTLLRADQAALELTHGKEFLLKAPAHDQVQQVPGDTLKSLLLSLVKSDDLPPALKEAISNTTQHITGQQLLLSAERNSPLTHLTLFIPFSNGEGQQTASVHIQSRKKGREMLDPSNCRLLFDLNMQVMGDTLVDVQVINSIVSLQIHNDHPAIPPLLEASRDEIASKLNEMGYQFMSLQCKPFPDLSKQKETITSKAVHDVNKAPQSYYQPKPYKGVDYLA